MDYNDKSELSVHTRGRVSQLWDCNPEAILEQVGSNAGPGLMSNTHIYFLHCGFSPNVLELNLPVAELCKLLSLYLI